MKWGGGGRCACKLFGLLCYTVVMWEEEIKRILQLCVLIEQAPGGHATAAADIIYFIADGSRWAPICITWSRLEPEHADYMCVDLTLIQKVWFRGRGWEGGRGGSAERVGKRQGCKRAARGACQGGIVDKRKLNAHRKGLCLQARKHTDIWGGEGPNFKAAGATGCCVAGWVVSRLLVGVDVVFKAPQGVCCR